MVKWASNIARHGMWCLLFWKGSFVGGGGYWWSKTFSCIVTSHPHFYCLSFWFKAAENTLKWVLRMKWGRGWCWVTAGAYENCASASNLYFWNGPQRTLMLKSWLGMDSPQAPLPSHLGIHTPSTVSHSLFNTHISHRHGFVSHSGKIPWLSGALLYILWVDVL